ncbi:hypothetical protein KIH77_07265 [Bifidobacterium sp. 82T24]|uniref:type II toxin-antitoxin system BrnA family antitoxin n=1 Tax=Bifidobacterium pluvialisilvae TaxID=2834436 RepID=UPI001C55F6C7|nr:BrnA antitoxin family protein [Bifidobacterium pluvialisilvae]MBW3088529.1 hypothetical protein [Bifidobacterium pluvialisilvae]
MTSTVKAADIDREFDEGKDVLHHFDLSKPIVEDAPANRKVNLTLPDWMVKRLDTEACNLAVSRNALINIWLAERIRHEDGARTR